MQSKILGSAREELKERLCSCIEDFCNKGTCKMCYLAFVYVYVRVLCVCVWGGGEFLNLLVVCLGSVYSLNERVQRI